MSYNPTICIFIFYDEIRIGLFIVLNFRLVYTTKFVPIKKKKTIIFSSQLVLRYENPVWIYLCS